MKHVPPSVKETAFNCPHCGALTTQYWYNLFGKVRDDTNPNPRLMGPEQRLQIEKDTKDNPESMARLLAWADKMIGGVPFFEKDNDGIYVYQRLNNVFISKCFNCKGHAVWVHDKLIFPVQGPAPPANIDLSADVRRDYDEASSILTLSPRGAAALVRLAIQKLCKELGQSGENINDNIKALVKDGLDARVQKALDAVRVIGNNAIHPGQIDLRDDRSTAESLFGLLNIIADKMISEPKHIDAVYGKLPQGALEQIAKRDGKS